MAASTYNQARKYPRVSAQIPVYIKNEDGDALYRELTTTQIALGGCMLVGDHNCNPPQLVEIGMNHDDMELTVKAQILYRFSERDISFTGVQFVDTSDEALTDIQELLNRL